MKVTSLSQLMPQDINVQIIMSDERMMEFPCREMTWARMSEIERSVPEYIGDVSAATEIGKTGFYVKKDHPAYLAALAAANQKRLMLKLAEFVRFEVPGNTLDERAAALSDVLTPDIVDGLARALNQMSRAQVAKVEDRADSFRGERSAVDGSGAVKSANTKRVR